MKDRIRRQEALRSGSAFVRIKEAAAMLDVARETIWAWYRKGILPPPVVIGGVRGWPVGVIRALMQTRQIS